MRQIPPQQETTQPLKIPYVGFLKGFKEFLRRYSVIGLAIAVVAGEAVNNLVQTIVKGLIGPTIRVLLPGEGLKKLVFVIKSVPFDIGGIIDAAIRFFIILFLIYFTVKFIMRDEGLLPPGKK